MYAKMAAKLRRKGLDCTTGDPVVASVLPDVAITVEPAAEGAAEGFAVAKADLCGWTTVPLGEADGDGTAFCVVQATATGKTCHAFACDGIVADSLGRAMASHASAVAEAGDASLDAPLQPGAKSHTITMGIGLGRRSTVKVSDGLRRQGTINLGGGGGVNVVRSSAFAGTFASIEPAERACELDEGEDAVTGLSDATVDVFDLVTTADESCDGRGRKHSLHSLGF